MFTFPTKDKHLIVSQSHDALFEWNYTLSYKRSLGQIDCGYVVANKINKYVIAKFQNDAPRVMSAYIEKIIPTFKDNSIGFKMKNCQLADVGTIHCVMGGDIWSKFYYLDVRGEYLYFHIYISS